VAVVGYQTRRFPGFYLTDAGFDLDWSAPTPEALAAILAARDAQGVHGGAIVVANPLPVAEQLDPAVHDRVLADGLAALDRDGVTGKAVTPYLLGHFHEATGGASLEVNVTIVVRNAELAARVAVAHAG
jgi:pseudouridine-5'-phosphate glycosidase